MDGVKDFLFLPRWLSTDQRSANVVHEARCLSLSKASQRKLFPPRCPSLVEALWLSIDEAQSQQDTPIPLCCI